jgi:CheY-like chemotaxis protein
MLDRARVMFQSKPMIQPLLAGGLPLHAQPSGPGDDDHLSAAQQGEAEATRATRVLIVEDEVFVAMDAEAILTAAGHEVVSTAASADEAVSKTAQLVPDLVLMDIRLLGDRDGIDAAIEIKRRFDVPIIFVTANTDPATHARAMQAAPLAIVSKPFTEDGLLDAVALLPKVN